MCERGGFFMQNASAGGPFMLQTRLGVARLNVDLNDRKFGSLEKRLLSAERPAFPFFGQMEAHPRAFARAFAVRL